MSAHNIVISFKLVANVVISSAQYRRETWKSTLIELNASWQLPCGTWELCEVTKGENLIELEQGSGVLIDIKEARRQSANHFEALTEPPVQENTFKQRTHKKLTQI